MSLESPVGSEDSSQLGDFIEDEDALEPMDAAAREMLREQVKNALAVLSERERQVLELRFGLVDGKDHTLEEVGQYFNVTRERIRRSRQKPYASCVTQRGAGICVTIWGKLGYIV